MIAYSSLKRNNLKQSLFAHLNKLPILLFYLFIFFIPQQFGPHFWPTFSFVKGIRIDYLSPTIYISDILILLLFLLSFKKVFTHSQTRSFLLSIPFITFVLILCIPFLYAQSPANLFYGLFSLMKLIYIGLFAAIVLRREHLNTIVFVFLISALLESVLAIFQFLTQGSLGGVFYFFGERTMNLSSIGAAVISTSYGLLLRPYGTFPHPNVLGFYLLTSVLLGFYILSKIQKKHLKLIIAGAFLVIEIAISLSFSRVVIMLNILSFISIGLLYGNVKNFRKHKLLVAFGLTNLLVFLVFFSNRFSNIYHISSAILPRVDLMDISFKVFMQYPLFGTGLQNYLFSQVDFQRNFSSVYLQPVHNIYLLILTQTGIMGFGVVMYFFYLTYMRLKIHFSRSRKNNILRFIISLLFLNILLAGFFDHYFLTIHQSQIIFALIFGLSWNNNIFMDSELE